MTPSGWKPSLDTLDAWCSFIVALVIQIAAALLLLVIFENQRAPRLPEEPRATVPHPPPCTEHQATR